MGSSTILYALKVLNEKSISVYKAKNVVTRDDLIKFKKETVEKQKTKKTPKKVHSKKKIISNSSESDETKSDPNQLPIIPVFLPSRRRKRQRGPS